MRPAVHPVLPIQSKRDIQNVTIYEKELRQDQKGIYWESTGTNRMHDNLNLEGNKENCGKQFSIVM